MKRYIFVGFTLTVFLLGGSLTYGDDTADLFSVWNFPNLLWILDTSSSMNTLPCNDGPSTGNQGCASSFFDSLGYPGPATTYTADEDFPNLFRENYVYHQGSYDSEWEQVANSVWTFTNDTTISESLEGNGYYQKDSNSDYYFTGNFLNFYPPRYVVARKVLKKLIMSTLVRIRMGLMVFDGDDGGKLIRGINPPCPLCLSSGAAYDSNRGSLINNINNTKKVDFWQSGDYTPLAETLFNAGQYLSASGFYAGQFGDTFVKSLGGTASDPVPYRCMANFAIIITDGAPTRDQKIPPSLKNYDDDCNECDVSGPSSVCQPFLKADCTTTCDDIRCYKDDGSDYLDDVAKWLYETDLRPDAGPCTENPAHDETCARQNLVTYTVGFAVDLPLLREAAANGDGIYYAANNAQELEEALKDALIDIINRAVSFTIPAVPSARVKDVRETTGLSSDDKIYLASFKPTREGPYEGHLRAYYLDCEGNIIGGEDCDPDECAEECEGSKEECICPLTECDGCELATDAEGNVADAQGNPFVQPVWDAGEKLQDEEKGGMPADDRKIYTAVDTDGDGELDQIDFSTSIASGPLSFLRAALNLNNVATDDFNGDGQITDADADLLIEFVRGKDVFDYDGDGDKTDDRPWKLGDIFHSSPVLVGQPNPLAYYEGFRCEPPHPDQYKKGFMDSYEIMLRPKMLIVGANDGMLHCFNVGNATRVASGDSDDSNTCWREDFKDFKSQGKRVKYDNGTGEEMWAFIPPNLLRQLKDLPRFDYNFHQYYVDGTPVVADVYLGGESFGDKLKKNWRTVVICGEREGGKHYFALDITYPNDNDPDDGNYECPRFLWEFTDPKMGFTWSEALHGGEYGRIKLDKGGTEIEKWVAVMGGGYGPNTVVVEGVTESYEGKAFFVVDIATGNKIWEFSSDPDMIYNIPSTPTPVDYNFIERSSDWFIDWVYIGDLGGQMWKMSFNQGIDGNNRLIPGNFDPATMEVSGWSGEIFFKGGTVEEPDQPIYFRPSTLIGLAGNLWIYFGTGDRNNPKDPDALNRFYGIMDFDDLEDPSGGRIQPSPPFTETDLTDVTGSPGDVSPINDPGNSQGWYIKLAEQEGGVGHNGEKVLAKSSALAGKVYFTAYTPAEEVEDPCGAGAFGAARLYAVRYQSGAATAFLGGERYVQIGTGIPSPVVITAEVVEGKVKLSAMLSTSSGQVIQVPGVGGGKLLNILSWKEVFRE